MSSVVEAGEFASCGNQFDTLRTTERLEKIVQTWMRELKQYVPTQMLLLLSNWEEKKEVVLLAVFFGEI